MDPEVIMGAGLGAGKRAKVGRYVTQILGAACVDGLGWRYA